jgi:hypothetical protein
MHGVQGIAGVSNEAVNEGAFSRSSTVDDKRPCSNSKGFTSVEVQSYIANSVAKAAPIMQRLLYIATATAQVHSTWDTNR